jgi:hypothetical protein
MKYQRPGPAFNAVVAQLKPDPGITMIYTNTITLVLRYNTLFRVVSIVINFFKSGYIFSYAINCVCHQLKGANIIQNIKHSGFRRASLTCSAYVGPQISP